MSSSLVLSHCWSSSVFVSQVSVMTRKSKFSVLLFSKTSWVLFLIDLVFTVPIWILFEEFGLVLSLTRFFVFTDLFSSSLVSYFLGLLLILSSLTLFIVSYCSILYQLSSFSIFLNSNSWSLVYVGYTFGTLCCDLCVLGAQSRCSVGDITTRFDKHILNYKNIENYTYPYI